MITIVTKKTLVNNCVAIYVAGETITKVELIDKPTWIEKTDDIDYIVILRIGGK